jgi:hypothetical protein
LYPALILLPILLFASGGSLVLPVLVRLLKPYKPQDIPRDWLETFSASSYHSMQQLLSEEDFAFLVAQPGFDFSLYRKLRRERLKIFRQYLNRLIADFNRLHMIARLLLSRSQDDQSDVLKNLIWLKVRFSLTILRVELNYVLCCFGSRTLGARAAIAQLEEMSARLTAIRVAAMAR